MVIIEFQMETLKVLCSKKLASLNRSNEELKHRLNDPKAGENRLATKSVHSRIEGKYDLERYNTTNIGGIRVNLSARCVLQSDKTQG